MFSFDLSQENCHMTLQAALIGKDGFVVASDTKSISGGGPAPGGTAMRRSSETRKIVVSQNGNLVCVSSLDQTARTLADKLIKDIDRSPGLDVRVCLSERIENALASFYDARRHVGGRLLIGIPGTHDGVSELHHIHVADGHAFSQQFYDHVVEGDRANSAVFFIERHYSNDKNVEELKLLAAHTVLQGGYLNPTYVSGLEVLIALNGKQPRFLSEDELLGIRLRSEALQSLLGEAIFRV